MKSPFLIPLIFILFNAEGKAQAMNYHKQSKELTKLNDSSFYIPYHCINFFKKNEKMYADCKYFKKPKPINYNAPNLSLVNNLQSIYFLLYQYKNDSCHIPFFREKMGYMDNHFNITIPLKYDTVTDFNGHAYAPAKLDGVWGLLDRQGNFFPKPEYALLLPTYTHDTYIAKQDNKYGLVNFESKPILDIQHTYLLELNTKKGFFAFKQDSVAGIYNAHINRVIYTKKSEYIYHYPLGKYLWIKTENDVNEVIDSNGTLITSRKFGEFIYFNDKFIIINKLQVGSFLYDIEQKTICTEEYTFIGRLHNGLALVKKQKKYGYMNELGKIVIPIIYDRADYYFSGNYSRVRLGRKNLKIDKEGKIIK